MHYLVYRQGRLDFKAMSYIYARQDSERKIQEEIGEKKNYGRKEELKMNVIKIDAVFNIYARKKGV